MRPLSRGFLLAAMSAAVLSPAAPAVPTVAEAQAFMEKVESTMMRLSEEAGRASWVQATYITYDTEILAAQATEKSISANVAFAKEAKRFDGLKMPADLARKFKLLKTSFTLPTPAGPALSEELTKIVTGMESVYGKGKYCPPDAESDPGKCIDLQEITRIMANSRDAKQLLDVWTGWRTISPPMRKDYQRFVELSNLGARELGFADTGAMWRSKYDMPPDAFARELDRLWEQVRPLYVSLHAYVRNRLREKYGDSVVPARGPIPAHLLGNPWAQSWDNIYPLVAPKDGDPGYDLTEILKSRNTDPLQMVRYGERFFTSLGFAPLPKTFWERSLFTKPQDREVVCHASAWDVDNVDDLRIKMCIEINEEDFATIHHELGHNFYQRAYNRQPFLFRDSANDGFHEAVGDTVSLSVTPEYLKKIGLLKDVPPASKDIGLLLRRALEKVAFLPFGLLIDQWRWKVFNGEITPDRYNQSWWELRRKYQGVAAPVARSEQDFDPGAKYHVPANVPYTRYFLAHILQFQFHRALAQAAGCKDPLHRCSIYANGEAGKRLRDMLAMGLSRPWPEALEALTGQKQMDATAIMDYFAPLKKWLDEQNAGKPVGW
ncbi:MAG: M2 family metallopeptidase [Bryobacteraceae bacterium]|nr:M2 family metallopeptidase [Bryobacterales bacterium]MEB2362616.1 M2 family metallopeptidase [Bryobacterales bacterium]NUN01563.1 M2 family metallopeptidase [Bryobacteraceae bacterium]